MITVNINKSTDKGVFALQSDAKYVIHKGIDISSTTGYAIDAGTGATNRAIVFGAHVTGEKGVLVGDDASGTGGGKLSFGIGSIVDVTADAVHIGADNERIANQGYLHGANGVFSLGTHTVLNNTGSIFAVSDAVHLAGGDAVVHNTGTISGAEGIVLGGSNLARNVVINNGGIGATAMAIEGSDGVDIIRNTGAIDGAIDLGFGDDKFDSRGGTVKGTIAGGTGNDLYVVDSQKLTLAESQGGGTDTVKSTVSYTLADNFENLTLMGKDAMTGTGNAGDNVMKGNAGESVLFGGDGKDRLDGGRGDDFLTGSTGADTFVFSKHSGLDTVIDFQATGIGHDRVDLSHLTGINSLDDVLAHAEQHGNAVVLDFGHGDELVLRHTDLQDLFKADFVF